VYHSRERCTKVQIVSLLFKIKKVKHILTNINDRYAKNNKNLLTNEHWAYL